MPSYTVVTFKNNMDKEKILEDSREKRKAWATYQERSIRLALGFSSAMLNTGKTWWYLQKSEEVILSIKFYTQSIPMRRKNTGWFSTGQEHEDFFFNLSERNIRRYTPEKIKTTPRGSSGTKFQDIQRNSKSSKTSSNNLKIKSHIITIWEKGGESTGK